MYRLMEILVEEVGLYYHIDPRVIAGHDRGAAEISEARMLVYFIARTRFALHLSTIAAAMQRHHTTVVHGVQQIENLRPDALRLAQIIGERVDRRMTQEVSVPEPVQKMNLEEVLADIEAVLVNLDRFTFDQVMCRVMTLRGGNLMICRPDKTA